MKRAANTTERIIKAYFTSSAVTLCLLLLMTTLAYSPLNANQCDWIYDDALDCDVSGSTSCLYCIEDTFDSCQLDVEEVFTGAFIVPIKQTTVGDGNKIIGIHGGRVCSTEYDCEAISYYYSNCRYSGQGLWTCESTGNDHCNHCRASSNGSANVYTQYNLGPCSAQ